ncbi:MAG: hypothetical protein MUC43_15460, partial [Pirellula sp.]|nr:hypothetical protein [Pirellula sp.]
VPILKRAPISAKLVSSNSNRTSLQPEIPFSSQPATLPGLGGQNPPTFGGPSPGMANPGMPNPGMVNPGMANPVAERRFWWGGSHGPLLQSEHGKLHALF